MLSEHTFICRPEGHLERALSVELPAARLNAKWWLACHLAVMEDRAMAKDYSEMTKDELREEWKRRDPERTSRLCEVSLKAYSRPRIIEALEKLDELDAQKATAPQEPKHPDVQTTKHLEAQTLKRQDVQTSEPLSAQAPIETLPSPADWQAAIKRALELDDTEEVTLEWAEEHIRELRNLNQRLVAGAQRLEGVDHPDPTLPSFRAAQHEIAELQAEIAHLKAAHQVELSKMREALSRKVLEGIGAWKRAGVAGVVELVLADAMKVAG